MALVRAATRIAADPAAVWAFLEDWDRQVEWMVDALSIRIVGEKDRGVGVVAIVETNIAGVVLDDPMRVTRWEPPRLMAIRHLGWPIRGVGWFEVTPEGRGCVFEWAEELDPPLGPLGELAAVALRPWIEATLRRSVENLRRLAERPQDSMILRASASSSDRSAGTRTHGR